MLRCRWKAGQVGGSGGLSRVVRNPRSVNTGPARHVGPLHSPPHTMARHWSPSDIPDLTGRTVVVTGANSGLGKETTRELARKGARVIMACRSEDRARRARAEILQDIGEAEIDVVILDLEDAVAPDAKELAREQALAALAAGGDGLWPFISEQT